MQPSQPSQPQAQPPRSTPTPTPISTSTPSSLPLFDFKMPSTRMLYDIRGFQPTPPTPTPTPSPPALASFDLIREYKNVCLMYEATKAEVESLKAQRDIALLAVQMERKRQLDAQAAAAPVAAATTPAPVASDRDRGRTRDRDRDNDCKRRPRSRSRSRSLSLVRYRPRARPRSRSPSRSRSRSRSRRFSSPDRNASRSMVTVVKRPLMCPHDRTGTCPKMDCGMAHSEYYIKDQNDVYACNVQAAIRNFRSSSIPAAQLMEVLSKEHGITMTPNQLSAFVIDYVPNLQLCSDKTTYSLAKFDSMMFCPKVNI
jgi:hypothetical protein